MRAIVIRELMWLLRELTRPLPADPFARRDPELIGRYIDLLEPVVDAWFAPEYTGFDRIPTGRSLLVGTHNGGFIGPDLFAFMVAVWRALGPSRPVYSLVHDVVFRIPLMASWMSKLGGVPARPDLARQLLERDMCVVVYPGGIRDAYKRYANRHVVDFYGRHGFIRAAIRAGAPIVPMVSAGAHDAIYVLRDGARLARALRLDRILRIDTLPLQLCVPWGIAVGPVPYVPLPCKVKLEVLPPIDLGLPPEAAGDPEAVAAAYDRVIAIMQAGVDRLAASGGTGLRARLADAGRRLVEPGAPAEPEPPVAAPR